MSSLDDLLGQLPIDEIADRLGVDRATAEAAVAHALPALVGGMQANAQDPDGAASLANALSSHDNGLIDSGAGLDDVDEADGRKIVGHVFGQHTDAVADRLGGLGAASGLGGSGGAGGSGMLGGLVAKVLPLIAPYVMSYLAKQIFGRGGASSGDASAIQNPGGLDLGSILGSILGGGAAGAGGSGGSGSSDGAGSLGGIDLGSILGGLGGLLGGGRR